MVTLGPTWDENGLIFTGCKLKNHVDVDVNVEFLDDWRIRLVYGWIFNESNW